MAKKIQTFHHPFLSWIHFLTAVCRELPYVPFPSVIFFEVSSFLLSYVAPLLSIVPSSLNLKFIVLLKVDYNSVSQAAKYVLPNFTPTLQDEGVENAQDRSLKMFTSKSLVQSLFQNSNY